VSAQQDNLQSQRFELKYIVEEHLALSIREFVRSYLEIDEFSASMPNLSYPVYSLYLDTPDLKLYHDTLNGSKNRFKLRLRFYENRAGAPVFCEIKRRMNNTIAKQRCGIRWEAIPGLLSGRMPAPADLLSTEPKYIAALGNFFELSTQLGATPRTCLVYQREAWISRNDNSVRVTLDRQVCTEASPGVFLDSQFINPVSIFGKQVILELKFTDRFPDWFGDLVRVFGLVQCSAAKYAEGVTLLGPHAVSRAFIFDDCEPAAPQRLKPAGNNVSPEQNAGFLSPELGAKYL
jgi:hypothetical protein